jgi:hypothetical protein
MASSTKIPYLGKRLRPLIYSFKLCFRSCLVERLHICFSWRAFSAAVFIAVVTILSAHRFRRSWHWFLILWTHDNDVPPLQLKMTVDELSQRGR